MNYREALTWLFATQLFGIKLGLENIQRLLAELQVPANHHRVIHVAGTNGKGSVCAMIDSICRAQGYRCGLFTSPHLVTFRERIQVNGEMIGESEVARGLTSIRDRVRDWKPHPTFFEIATTLGLLHFKHCDCEVIVLETGMGGRLDATNAVTPVVSVITPIDFDHQKWLGNTLTEIATEKAGIIKPKTPVVSAMQLPEAEQVIRARSAGCNAPLQFVRPVLESRKVALAGAHQKQNGALAIAALRAGGFGIGDDAIACGLASVHWPARSQRWDERTVIDGAHNPAGARTLVKTWREEFGDERSTIVLAVLGDKDVSAIVEALRPIAQRFLLPRIRSERAESPSELQLIVRRHDLECLTFSSSAAAISAARNFSERILITGSLHFAGEALAILRGDPNALEDCAQ